MEDNDILAYRYGDDGTRIEPEFFVPIIPIVILETESIPAHGWNQTRHARDFLEVCDRVKSLINNYNKYIPILNSKELNSDNDDDSHTSSSLSS